MSRRQVIIDDLLEALQAMSEGAGFNFDWLQWWKWKQVEFTEHPAGMIVEGRESHRDIVYPKIERRLSLTLEAEHLVPTGWQDEPSDTARQLVEDIERAVLADPTRGENAVDTLTVGNEFWVGEGSVFAIVEIEIVYHTNRMDPGASV